MSISLVKRSRYLAAIQASLHENPITALIGPRQCGKTTLARLFQDRDTHYFDLEHPGHMARLEPDAFGILGGLEGLVIIDEVQRMPQLFPMLRVLADEPLRRQRFLILGSASPDLFWDASESLAGRIRFIELGGFDIEEVGRDHWQRLWLRGGFPRSFLHPDNAGATECREDFLKAYIGRDLARLAETRLPTVTLWRLLRMMGHYHGQTWNHSEIANSLGVDGKTVKRYLDIFTGSYLLRQLPPLLTNTKKRLVKAPKIYFRDSGILHSLLGGITHAEDLLVHPKRGASWEGFALEETIRHVAGGDDNCFFWATHGGAEIDLVIEKSAGRIGFEFKATAAPSTTKSMHVALDDLSLEKVFVVYPGFERIQLDRRIEAIPVHVLQFLGSTKKRGWKG